MSNTETVGERGAFAHLVPIQGQTLDAGLCVDGVCALPEPERQADEPAQGSADRHQPQSKHEPAGARLTLISVPLCPFVQRAIIALKEKRAEFDVIYVDLQNRPDWFKAISPLGKVPVLKVERDGEAPAYVFGSSVILEYLEETVPGRRLHPEDALERAQHRAWMEFGSQVLGDIWKFGAAHGAEELETAKRTLLGKLQRLEDQVVGPFFSGEDFSYVDAVFGPAFRQIDTIETVRGTGLLDGFPKLRAWRGSLAARSSIRDAAPADFVELYLELLRKSESFVLRTS